MGKKLHISKLCIKRRYLNLQKKYVDGLNNWTKDEKVIEHFFHTNKSIIKKRWVTSKCENKSA